MFTVNTVGTITTGLAALGFFVIAFKTMQASMAVHYEEEFQYVDENRSFLGCIFFFVGWVCLFMAVNGVCLLNLFI